MKLRHKFALPVVAACLCFTATSAHAVITLTFSASGTARASGFSDSAGLVGVNGMRWGLIVDTGWTLAPNPLNGLSPGLYDAGFDVNTSGFLSINGVLTDDYYVANAAGTLTTTSASTTDNVTNIFDLGGPGTITGIANAPYGGATNITQGDPFALVWFPSANSVASHVTLLGESYGMLQNQSVTAEFDIPSDATNSPFASQFFLGTDSIKAANLIMQGIPEPSRLILLGVGAMGLLLRRRRS